MLNMHAKPSTQALLLDLAICQSNHPLLSRLQECAYKPESTAG